MLAILYGVNNFFSSTINEDHADFVDKMTFKIWKSHDILKRIWRAENFMHISMLKNT
jgi:hypothetical protein